MLVDLDKRGLASLIRGNQYPSYEDLDNPLVKDKGYYVGGFHDKWVWDFDCNSFTEENLYATWILMVAPRTSKTKEPSLTDNPVYRELQNILEDGHRLKNYSMIQAAEKELDRLGWNTK